MPVVIFQQKWLKIFCHTFKRGCIIGGIISNGWSQISNEGELQTIVDAVLKANPDVVEKIKNGKVGSANFLMGQVMKETKGRAKPDAVRELILNACKD